MTFEQGGIGSGLGVKKEDGDTLTLADRALHHFTTAMSTIEMASANASQLVAEYKQFFADAANAVNAPYKTYVLTNSDKNKLAAVAQLLKKNGIEYGITSTKTFSGFNYLTGKEEEYCD